MSDQVLNHSPARIKIQEKPIFTWLAVAGSVYLILLAVSTVGSGFKWMSGGADGARELFEFATNPFMGLVIGTLTTALVQSSSTVTSVIVALVAGGLPVSIAIPMIMGANIGTTITNTIVSLGHVRNKEEFRPAFAAATIHDFFNLLSVIIFLPLEMAFGLLEKTSVYLTALFTTGSSLDLKSLNFIEPITKPVVGAAKSGFVMLGESIGPIVMIVAGVGLIVISITFLGKLLKKVMVGKAKQIFHSAIGRGPISGIASGTFITVLVQSSSTTTSLAVPLVGAGVFKPREIYPFTLGANIGTCVTALIAAIGVTGGSAVFALQIAMVHLLYNVLGVVVIYGIPMLREIPPKMAEWLAEISAERKSIAVAYVVSVFLLFPGLMIAATS